MATKSTSLTAIVPTNAKLKERWENLSLTIAATSAEGAASFDELWEAVAQIVDHEPPLYVFGGHKNAAAFFRDVLHESERVARRNIRVARFATPADENRYGTQLLDAALGYLEAKAGKHLDGSLPVDFTRLRIEVKNGPSKKRLPLAECTVAMVTAATRELLAKGGKSRAKRSESERVLSLSLAKHDVFKGVVVRDHDGLFSFQHVPAGSLALFGRTVAAHRGAR